MALTLLLSDAMIAVLILSGCVAAGLILGLIATATAPIGYQDDSGFHYGSPHGVVEAEVPCPVPVPQPKLA